jgi:hypothetical protein
LENLRHSVKLQQDSSTVKVISAESGWKVYGLFFAEDTITRITYLDMLEI